MSRIKTPEIIRTERGLTISGTRITLYDVLGYLHAQWTTERIRDILQLTDEQLRVAVEYIAAHRQEVETELQQVLLGVEEAHNYWQARNEQRLTQIAELPAKPGTEMMREKLTAHRAHRARSAATNDAWRLTTIWKANQFSCPGHYSIRMG